ncbi:hypothetical protein [Streptomyces sp. NPDC021224]|uniref:hypothetical protein n=1 Tax=unclassified Streptomyces TaxID=2593676 RepID=UPI0037AB803F
MRTRTALGAAAIPTFLLLSACGGGDGGNDDASPSAPARTTAAPKSPTSGATASADPAAAFADKVTAQLQLALKAAHLTPAEKDDKHLPCAITFPRFYEVGKGSPRTREHIVASLTAAGWKTAISGGADESHLTSDDDWEVFVTREQATGDDGKAYEMLDVAANCIDHAADNLFSQ